jgi:hypothetical protein
MIRTKGSYTESEYSSTGPTWEHGKPEGSLLRTVVWKWRIISKPKTWGRLYSCLWMDFVKPVQCMEVAYLRKVASGLLSQVQQPLKEVGVLLPATHSQSSRVSLEPARWLETYGFIFLRNHQSLFATFTTGMSKSRTTLQIWFTKEITTDFLLQYYGKSGIHKPLKILETNAIRGIGSFLKSR